MRYEFVFFFNFTRSLLKYVGVTMCQSKSKWGELIHLLFTMIKASGVKALHKKYASPVRRNHYTFERDLFKEKLYNIVCLAGLMPKESWT